MSGVIPPLSLYVFIAYRDSVTFTKVLMAEQHFPFTKGLMFKILAVEFSASACPSNIRNGVKKICGLNLEGAA
jgi:hypothetical protein